MQEVGAEVFPRVVPTHVRGLQEQAAEPEERAPQSPPRCQEPAAQTHLRLGPSNNPPPPPLMGRRTRTSALFTRDIWGSRSESS